MPTCIARLPALQSHTFDPKRAAIAVGEVGPGVVGTNGRLQMLSCEAMDARAGETVSIYDCNLAC
jgi:hypothetical protein